MTGVRSALMVRAFEALGAAGISAVILRGDPSDPASDLDVLVDDPGLVRTASVWCTTGLAATARDAHTASFLGYDEAADTWVAIDAADGVAIGGRWVPSSQVLARATGSTPPWHPDPDDAWWLALLHEVGGRRRPRPDRLARLAATSPVEGHTSARPAPMSPAIRDALVAVNGLAPATGALALALATRGPAAGETRRAVKRVQSALRDGIPEPLARARRARARRAARRRGAMTVALLGPDGVGKSTLAVSLRGPRGRSLAPVYLGMYGRGSSASDPGRVPGLGLARRLLILAAARARVARLRAAGRWVVLDRHPIDGVVAAPSGSRTTRLRRRLLAMAAPTPDLIVVLDAPIEVLLQRKQEHGPERLAAMMAGYRWLAGIDPRARLVDAQGPADDVRRSVQAAIAARLAQRQGQSPADRAETTGGDCAASAGPRVVALRRFVTSAGRVVARLQARLELRRAHPLAVAIVRDATQRADRGKGSADLVPNRGSVALSGVCVFPVARDRAADPPGGAPVAYLRVARRTAAARSIRRSTRVLRSIGTLPVDGAWRALVPELMIAGRLDGWTYLMEGARPGIPAQDRPPGDETWLMPAAAAVGGLHDATARLLTADDRLLARLVDHPIRRISLRLPEDRLLANELAALGARVRGAVAGSELRLGWVHGDCWAGNVLLAPDGSVTGLVDWDSAGCPAPGAVDLVHLLAHARRRRTATTYGASLLALLDGAGLTEVERKVLGQGRLDPVAAGPAELRGAAFALAWLYVVDGSLRRYPGIAGNATWVDDVVRRVVRCL